MAKRPRSWLWLLTALAVASAIVWALFAALGLLAPWLPAR